MRSPPALPFAMVTTVLVSMLCAHLLCFSVMFLLMSWRLRSQTMGMGFFAMGNLLLACAYALQLAEGGPAWSLASLVNHTFTLTAPMAFLLGAMRFFGQPVSLVHPLLVFPGVYLVAQVLVQWTLGPAARYALLSATAALLFLAISIGALHGVRTFASNFRWEMVFWATLIGGLGVLNAIKFLRILQEGMPALQMDQNFQLVFYIYMTFLTTVLPPFLVWLVLCRLTDDLRDMAARDPMTRLLNRRGMTEALQQYFRSRKALPAYVLMVDVDHFKRINDLHGHPAGDAVLCQVAETLQATVRRQDLVARMGGEEFVVVCLESDAPGVRHMAERLRAAVQAQSIAIVGAASPLHCTITVGMSERFYAAELLEDALQIADAALYRGKSAGRNRVEPPHPAPESEAVPTAALPLHTAHTGG